ncbi:MAG: DNA mismatch repair protein MutS2 [Chloroflexi bacterium]|nr:MAG: DNA mismatch repair protein MutS2 [Chloroflexota bacterium]
MPSSDVEEVRRRQRLTAEAVALRTLKPQFGLGAIGDVEPAVEGAARGAILPATDLLLVAGFLGRAQAVRNHLLPMARELPGLSHMGQRIGEFGGLIKAIEAAVAPSGEIREDASPDLPRLRRETREKHDRLVARMEGILQRAIAQGIAQDSIITERDGRYVIPIKAESRSHIRSVVHDVSSSGATVFVEPLVVVEMGNAWREARLAEEREIQRILRRLSEAIGAEGGTIEASLGAIAEIDVVVARAALGVEMGAALPAAGDREIGWVVEAPSELRLQTARHPLLTGEVVPISLMLGGEHPGVLVTGPNTGGKTVALKTAGLLALMAQAGMAIPGEPGCRFPVYAGVYADIGDEQSIEQSLSTFSSHMTNIIRILSEADAHSLVLLDELGAGTDPTEGAALGRAILSHLLTGDVSVMATTHHSELKLFAHQEAAVQNASVDFDPETLAPTYRLRLGLPGRSNAIAIARRLGMPESVLANAEAGVGQDDASVEGLLADLQREHAAASDARAAEEFARGEAEEIRHGLAQSRDELEAKREGMIARTELEMETELAGLRRATRAAEKQLLKGRRDDIERARREGEEAEAHLVNVRQKRSETRRRRARRAQEAPLDPSAIRAGDKVFLAGIEQAGEALGLVGEDGTLEVQLGALRSRVPVDQVERTMRDGSPVPSAAIHYDLAPVDVESRLEVRGQTLDEAIPAVESFLDQAYRAGLQRLELVHGKGTGTLRQAVRELLRLHPLVSSYEGAERREGGEGVTIVRMAV